MSVRGTNVLVTALVALAASRCEIRPEQSPPARATADASAEEETFVHEAPPTAPIALRAWLEQRQYRETWELWPGTEPLHPGAEGHGALHTTRVGPLAMDALSRTSPVMPPGAVVVLEEHLADSLPSAVSVMIRGEGDEAGAQDWHFARFGSTGEIEPAGACAGCHVKEPDWLFSGEVGTPLPVDSTGVVVAAPGSS